MGFSYDESLLWSTGRLLPLLLSVLAVVSALELELGLGLRLGVAGSARIREDQVGKALNNI